MIVYSYTTQCTHTSSFPEMPNTPVNGYINTIKAYSILGIVGKGTYGEVYKAIHLASGDIVALKKVKMGFLFDCRFVIRTSGFPSRPHARFDSSPPCGIRELFDYAKWLLM